MSARPESAAACRAVLPSKSVELASALQDDPVSTTNLHRSFQFHSRYQAPYDHIEFVEKKKEERRKKDGRI
jgi:hypothetical protein